MNQIHLTNKDFVNAVSYENLMIEKWSPNYV